MNQELKELAAMTAINNMLGKGYFDICAVDRAAKLLDASMKGLEEYDVLSALHCIDYAKMDPTLRAEIPALIQECLGVAPTFKFKTLRPQEITIDVSPGTQKDGPVHRGWGRVLKLLG